MFFCGNMFFCLKLKYSDSQKCSYKTKNHLSKSGLCAILPQKYRANFHSRVSSLDVTICDVKFGRTIKVAICDLRNLYHDTLPIQTKSRKSNLSEVF